MCSADASKAQSIRNTSVFNEALMTAPFPDNFKMPSITPYDDKGDLFAYMEIFCSWIDFERVSGLARCQAFTLTLSRLA